MILVALGFDLVLHVCLGIGSVTACLPPEITTTAK